MSSPVDNLIEMQKPNQQEGGCDGFRDAIPEKFPGQCKKWREKVALVTGAELKEEGYIVGVDPDDVFILGELSLKVVETLELGLPDDCEPGKWIRYLHDLSLLSWQRVRFGDDSNPLAGLANVSDGDSALRFVKRVGFPVQSDWGLFESTAFQQSDPEKTILFGLPRPVASLTLDCSRGKNSPLCSPT